MDEGALSNPLRAAIEEQLGSGWSRSVLSGRSASSARVLHVRGANAELFVKSHREQRRFEQEWAFYRRHAEALQPHVPRLLGALPEARSLLLSAVAGRKPSAWAPADALTLRGYEAAGLFLRELHRLPNLEKDELPLSEALRVRVNALLRSAEQEAFALRLRRLEGEIAALVPAAAVRSVCHRDFQPDNWLFDADTASVLRVIDFEHARPDLHLFDLARLDLLYLSPSPALAGAFWAGYGGAPTAAWAGLYQAVKLMEAARTTIWAKRHADAAFLDESRRMWRAIDGL